MGRVTWDDGKKVRLSPAAIELLRRMCSDGIAIHYESRAGKYTRIVNGVSETVQERTVEALARAGFISRLKDETPSYVANVRARELFKRTEEEPNQMTDEQLRTIHRDRARAFNEQAERERAARRARLESQPAQPEIKTHVTVSNGERAIQEIKRLQSHAGGTPQIKVFSAAEHEARINHILNVSQSTRGETMSNQPKPEPPVTVIAEKARDYQKQQHAKGNRFYSIAEAVTHVRKEMGLSTDTLATDADMTRRANAQD